MMLYHAGAGAGWHDDGVILGKQPELMRCHSAGLLAIPGVECGLIAAGPVLRVEHLDAFPL
jgi:ABC-type iron transport system FetAB permease component